MECLIYCTDLRTDMDNVYFTVIESGQLYHLLNSKLIFFYVVGRKHELFGMLKKHFARDDKHILLSLFYNLAGSRTYIVFLEIIYPFRPHYDQVDVVLVGKVNNSIHHCTFLDHRLTRFQTLMNTFLLNFQDEAVKFGLGKRHKLLLFLIFAEKLKIIFFIGNMKKD